MNNSQMIKSRGSNRTIKSYFSAEVVLLCIIYIGFFSVTRTVSVDEIASDAFSSKAIRIAFIFIAFFVSVLIFLHRKSSHALKSPSVRVLLLYFMACIASIPNSLFPSLSLIKSLEVFQAILLCLVGISSLRSEPYKFFDFHLKIISFITVLVLIESIIFPGIAWSPVKGQAFFQKYMLRGVFPAFNPNTVGLIGGVLAVAYFPKMMIEKKRYDFLLFAVGILTVVLSYSRSSLFAVICSIMLLLLFINRKYLSVIVALVTLICLVAGPFLADIAFYYFIRGQDVESVSQIVADRPTIWKYIWSINHDSFFGLGLGATFTHPVLSRTGWGHAHNTFFQLLGDLGWVGISAWVLMIYTISGRIIAIYRNELYDNKVEFYSAVMLFVYLVIKTFGHATLYIFNYDFIAFVSVIIYTEKSIQYRNIYKYGKINYSTKRLRR